MRERARITDIYLAVGGLTGVGFVGPLLLVSVIRRQELQYYVYVLAHYPQARADTRFAEAVRQLSGSYAVTSNRWAASTMVTACPLPTLSHKNRSRRCRVRCAQNTLFRHTLLTTLHSRHERNSFDPQRVATRTDPALSFRSPHKPQ